MRARVLPLVPLLLGAAPVLAQEKGYVPAPPDDVPEIVNMMRPSSIPRADLLIRDGCYYYRDRHGEVRPFDFAGPALGTPYCTGDAPPAPTTPLPRSR
ncbi:hypothetical protein [Jannaschia marina]|uniref:hypothetical protein n=1 Tax=Jannaschia marina TaxID=2741674 RepID=UPI0015C7EB4B|nr:hypothetical protein [Jannaschia marina]